jgi:hypothetical protein
MLNASEQTLLTAQNKARRAVSQSKHPHPKVAATRAITAMMSHGGLYTLLDSQLMTARLSTMAQNIPELLHGHASPASFVAAVGSSAESFFEHLVTNPYTIHSNLMSHIAFPHEGTTYTSTAEEMDPMEAAKLESPDLSAAITFIGQFIDHDLTMNAVDLFLDQRGSVQNTASPLIDLDSVFGPRSLLDTTIDAETTQDDLYEEDKRTLRLKIRKTKDGQNPVTRRAVTHGTTMTDRREEVRDGALTYPRARSISRVRAGIGYVLPCHRLLSPPLVTASCHRLCTASHY